MIEKIFTKVASHFQLKMRHLLGPDVNACSFTPSKWYGINLAPPKNLNLSIAESTITADPSKPTADGKFSVSPDVPTRIYINVSGSDFNSPENRNTTVSLQIGTRPLLQKVVPLSAIAATGSYQVPFDVTFTPEEAGALKISAEVNPGNLLQETDSADNKIQDKIIYVLCDVADKGVNVPDFKQIDAHWGNDLMGSNIPLSYRMRASGCMVTNVAMLLNAYGFNTASNGQPLTPKTLNQEFLLPSFWWQIGIMASSENAYSVEADMHPNAPPTYARNLEMRQCLGTLPSGPQCSVLSKKVVSLKKPANRWTETQQKFVYKELCQGNPVILEVPGMRDPSKKHFVLATKMSVSEESDILFGVRNPGSNQPAEQIKSVNDSGIRGYRLYRPTDDPSMVFFNLAGAEHMIITDPMGRRTGFDPFTSTAYDEIPGATFFQSESIDSTDPNYSASAPVTKFEGFEPLNGTYGVKIMSKTATPYTLKQFSFDDSGTINQLIKKTGTLQAMSSLEVSAQHTSNAIPINYGTIQIENGAFIDKVHTDRAVLTGSLKTDDSSEFPPITKDFMIKVGPFTKSIPAGDFKKLKEGKESLYSYKDWGKGGLVVEFNSSTGEFIAYIDNLDLDDSLPTLKTDISFKVDDFYATTSYTFQNVIRRSKSGK